MFVLDVGIMLNDLNLPPKKLMIRKLVEFARGVNQNPAVDADHFFNLLRYKIQVVADQNDRNGFVEFF
jgi:hypothetical protein